MINNFFYTKTEIDKVLKTMGILIDTREQKNEHIIEWLEKKKIPYKNKGLGFGDYSYYLPENSEFSIFREMHFDNDIVIERKGSVDEVAGNFSTDRDRIEKEFSLCPAKIFLLIEGSYKDMSLGNYRSNYGAKACIATLHSFESRYGLSVFFNEYKDLSAQYIYLSCYYHLRSKLK